MRFWQKIFIGVLLIFMIAFDVGAYYIISYSYQFDLKRETDNATREQEIILSDIQNNIASLRGVDKTFSDAEKNYDHTIAVLSKNKERLINIISPKADYYKKQDVFMALYNEKTVIYSNAPEVSTDLLELQNESAKNVLDETHDQIRYLFVASKVADYPHLTFVYARDITGLDDFLDRMRQAFIWLNIIVCVVLALAVYIILRGATRPIKRLNEITRKIAGGEYSKRVHIKSNDELGELADTFNTMADAVEKNVQGLEKTAEDRQSFINDLSHEMQTPLTSVLGYSEYLQRARGNEEDQFKAIGNLHLSAQQLSNLAKKLMDITYLSQKEIEKTKISTLQLFDTLKRMMNLSLTDRGLTLKTETNGETLMGDEHLLLSLLTNLVENAARASEEGQAIRLRSFYDHGKTMIEVADNGRGMNAEDIEKITLPFYRVDRSRSRKKGGVGLGMAIAKEIIELHGAKLKITSQINCGTTMRIEFTTL